MNLANQFVVSQGLRTLKYVHVMLHCHFIILGVVPDQNWYQRAWSAEAKKIDSRDARKRAHDVQFSLRITGDIVKFQQPVQTCNCPVNLAEPAVETCHLVQELNLEWRVVGFFGELTGK